MGHSKLTAFAQDWNTGNSGMSKIHFWSDDNSGFMIALLEKHPDS
jgi:hypothetical protein